MNIDFNLFFALILAHLVGDGLLQTYEMATNKSKSNAVLWQHGVMYSLPFWVLMIVGLPAMSFNLMDSVTISVSFALLVVCVPHVMVDWLTSRISADLWEEAQKTPQTYHWFFLTILVDQAIHVVHLFLLGVLIT